jgi:hypothetical protein
VPRGPFFICLMIFYYHRIDNYCDEHSCKNIKYLTMNLHRLAYVLPTINSLFNPIIYAYLDKKYRKLSIIFCSQLCFAKAQEVESNHSEVTLVKCDVCGRDSEKCFILGFSISEFHMTSCGGQGCVPKVNDGFYCFMLAFIIIGYLIYITCFDCRFVSLLF